MILLIVWHRRKPFYLSVLPTVTDFNISVSTACGNRSRSTIANEMSIDLNNRLNLTECATDEKFISRIQFSTTDITFTGSHAKIVKKDFDNSLTCDTFQYTCTNRRSDCLAISNQKYRATSSFCYCIMVIQ